MDKKKARRIAPAGSFVVWPLSTPEDDARQLPLFYVVESAETGEQRIYSLRGINRGPTSAQLSPQGVDKPLARS